MNIFKIPESNTVTGIYIFSIILSVTYAIIYNYTLFFGLSIFLFAGLVLSASAKDKHGSVSKNLSDVGINADNSTGSIVLGIIGGITAIVFTLFLGINYDTVLTNLVISRPLIVPQHLELALHIIYAIFIVSIAEETLKLIVAPFGFKSIFKMDDVTAYILSVVFWMGLHVPSYANNLNAYAIAFFIGLIGIGLYMMTNSILAPIITHSVYNLFVVLKTVPEVNSYAQLTLYIIIIIVIYTLLNPQKSNRRR